MEVSTPEPATQHNTQQSDFSSSSVSNQSLNQQNATTAAATSAGKREYIIMMSSVVQAETRLISCGYVYACVLCAYCLERSSTDCESE